MLLSRLTQRFLFQSSLPLHLRPRLPPRSPLLTPPQPHYTFRCPTRTDPLTGSPPGSRQNTKFQFSYTLSHGVALLFLPGGSRCGVSCSTATLFLILGKSGARDLRSV